jgi:hypothetical protein
MAYIVDMTLIMQNIFWLIPDNSTLISRRVIKLAFMAYKESTVKAQIHSQIANFVERRNIIDRGNWDAALNKIVELINSSLISSSEMLVLKEKFKGFDISLDEPWDTR